MNKVEGGDPDLCLLDLPLPTAHKVATEFSGECCQSQETARVLERSLKATRLEGHYRSSSCGVLGFRNILKPLSPVLPNPSALLSQREVVWDAPQPGLASWRHCHSALRGKPLSEALWPKACCRSRQRESCYVPQSHSCHPGKPEAWGLACSPFHMRALLLQRPGPGGRCQGSGSFPADPPSHTVSVPHPKLQLGNYSHTD